MQDIQSACKEYIFETYARLPIAVTRGKGCRLWDTNGKEYLDFLAGIAVCNLGHSNPEVTRALAEQADILVHVSNLFYTQPQVEVAAELTRLSFADKVFFSNSGAEANEAAIKIARKYSRDKYGPGRFHIITMENSFHGRTMATLSATAQEKIHKGFEPLVEGFTYVPFNSVEAVEAAVTQKTCAVMVEPVQGEGGLNFALPGYFAGLRELCRKRDLLLIFDEVQTGMGRTGTLFAYEQEGIEPDVMTLAKALGNGLPIGAMLASAAVAPCFVPGTHGSTFGGTPLVTAVALKVVKTLSDPAFLAHVREMGAAIMEGLKRLQSRYPFIRDVRGRGLLIGLELTVPGKPVVDRCLEKGLIINCTHDTVLRFVPPLIIERADVDRFLSILDEALREEAS